MSDINSDYETELKGATIKIGGSSEKFVPNINASKWNDECFLNINYPLLITDEEETFIDGEIEIEIENEGVKEKHKYYIDENGCLEYEIELDSAPLLPQIAFNLVFSEGLRFCYQDTLENAWRKNNSGYETLEEYLENHYRPENIEGSYAVYWKEMNNQYKTGKFCHIPKPTIYDRNGDPVFGEIRIQDNILRITWPEDIEYPIRIDPTIGYDTAGQSSYGHSTRTCGTIFTAPVGTGVTTLYHVAWGTVNASNGAHLGYYPVSGSDPSGQSPIEDLTISATLSDDDQHAAGGTTIESEVEYYLCFAVAHSATDMKYDTDGVGFYAGTTYASCLEDPLPNATGEDKKFSIWIDYEAAGGETHELTGTIPGVASVTDGLLHLIARVSGDTTGVASVTNGALRLIARIAGDVTGQSTADGTLKLIADLVGTISALSVVGGDLTIDAVLYELVGTISSLSTTGAAAKLIARLAGDIAAQSDSSGAIKGIYGLTGDTDGQSSISANLYVPSDFVKKPTFEVFYERSKRRG